MTDPGALSRRYVEAFNQRDWAAMRSMLTDRVDYTLPGLEVMTDPEDVVAFYCNLTTFEATSDLVMEVIQSVSDGERWAAFMNRSVAGPPGRTGVFMEWVDERLTTYRAFAETPLPPGD